MKNLIILYNPYYEKDVIEQHLKVLIENQKVAFGKVRSKLKNIEHNFQDDLENIYRLEENGKPLYDFRKLLYDYFQPLAEKYKEKNINKNNNINNKENSKHSSDDSEEVLLLPSFNNFLFELKNRYNLIPSQLKFADFDFFNLCKNYDFESVKKYLEKYFVKLKEFSVATVDVDAILIHQ